MSLNKVADRTDGEDGSVKQSASTIQAAVDLVANWKNLPDAKVMEGFAPREGHCQECDLPTSNAKFCNRKCSADFNSRNRQRRETKSCPSCGADFESLICRRQRYCSVMCGNVGKQIKVDLVCEQCGETYQRHTSKASQSRYCGNACKQIAGANRRAATEMSQEEYSRRYREQGGKCALCHKGEVQTHKRGGGKTIKLTKDHDHKTGEWRGLLCRRCNMALGLFDDDIAVLLRAADYVLDGGVRV